MESGVAEQDVYVLQKSALGEAAFECRQRGCMSTTTTRPDAPTSRANSTVKNPMPGPGSVRHALARIREHDLGRIHCQAPEGTDQEPSHRDIPVGTCETLLLEEEFLIFEFRFESYP